MDMRMNEFIWENDGCKSPQTHTHTDMMHGICQIDFCLAIYHINVSLWIIYIYIYIQYYHSQSIENQRKLETNSQQIDFVASAPQDKEDATLFQRSQIDCMHVVNSDIWAISSIRWSHSIYLQRQSDCVCSKNRDK